MPHAYLRLLPQYTPVPKPCIRTCPQAYTRRNKPACRASLIGQHGQDAVSKHQQERERLLGRPHGAVLSRGQSLFFCFRWPPVPAQGLWRARIWHICW